MAKRLFINQFQYFLIINVSFQYLSMIAASPIALFTNRNVLSENATKTENINHLSFFVFSGASLGRIVG